MKVKADSLNVLIADDLRFNQKAISKYLSRSGHRVSIVANGRDAFRESQVNLYDVIFLDARMPLMSGLEAARAIRHAEKESDLHVVMVGLVTQGNEKERQECFESGMDACITKPIRREELLTTLDSLLSSEEEPFEDATIFKQQEQFLDHDETEDEEAEKDEEPQVQEQEPVAIESQPLSKRIDENIIGQVFDSEIFSEEDKSSVASDLVIDTKQALEIHEGDKDFLKENAQKFVETVPQTLDEVKRSLASSNFDSIHEAMDTIIDAASYLGAIQVIHLAGQIKQIKPDETEQLAWHLEKLENALNQLKEKTDNL